MNRKNLTAAVLAGLAGVAGLAGTAQAVNLNPDGLGQVLIYPYYTTNAGNQTILSVVNTTDQAKAVKVRFLEGYNSREVLDFNLYMSAYDVWVAAIADGGNFDETQEGVPHLVIPDTSCTVPYLYGDGIEAGLDFGLQSFLPYAYSGKNNDGGPDETLGGPLPRASEGYFEMIEMGTLTNASERPKSTSLPRRPGSAEAATHIVNEDGDQVPLDCYQLVRNWTDYDVGAKTDPLDGMWFEQSQVLDLQATIDTTRNRGGLFGGAAIVNSANGTMFSYDAKAIQGFDKTPNGKHFRPGNIRPSLNDGSVSTAYIAFGPPNNEVVDLTYPRGRSVEAISAVFMHDNLMNTFTIQEDLNAATEWVLTFPTKAWHVDVALTDLISELFIPDVNDPDCNNWEPGDFFPPGDEGGVLAPLEWPAWVGCSYVEIERLGVYPPFTEAFDGEACEIVSYDNWDREENASVPGTPGSKPPIVSPPPPPGTSPKPTPFELCYEVNVLRFGDESIFGTESDLLRTVSGTPESGWANLNFNLPGKFKGFDIELHQDRWGLVGLPVTGFAAEEYENGFLEGGSVLANYGGLFQHKASVRRIRPFDCYHGGSCPTPE